MAVKQSSSRRRTSGSAKHLSVQDIETDARKHPRLGKRDDGEVWHPKVKLWWGDLWSSPVAANFDITDHLTAWELADIKHRRMIANSNTEIVRLSGEERAISNVLGLNPKARAIQKVEIDKGDQAERRTRKRQNRAVVAANEDGKPVTQVADPRDALTG